MPVGEVVDELGGEHIVVLWTIEVKNVLTGEENFRGVLAFLAGQSDGGGVLVNRN